MKAEIETEPAEETMDVDVVVVGGSGVFSAGQMFGAIEEENLDYVREVFLEHTMDFPVDELCEK